MGGIRIALWLPLALWLTLAPLGAPALAQGPEPPAALDPAAGGLPVQPGTRGPLAAAGEAETLGTGGPDAFGYTWDEGACEWIDAAAGTDAGLPEAGYYSGPVDIGFSFKYYENAYSELYISQHGYVSFSYAVPSTRQSRFPDPAPPNTVIAPYWALFYLGGSGPTNRVYYLRGGQEPNRYLVVQWHQVKDYYNNVYSFQVVLREDGDILFQYQGMQPVTSYPCAIIGIEDSTGTDGLMCRPYCSWAPSNSSVHFHRPAPAARPGIRPAYQGSFAAVGEPVSFTVSVRNLGELAADSFDLLAASEWAVSLFQADGSTPLEDSNSNGLPDVGPLDQGAATDIVVAVQAPAPAAIGDWAHTVITASSHLSPTQVRSARLQTAIPAAFALTYGDNTIGGGLELYLMHPAGQAVRPVNSGGGAYPALAETSAGFANCWSGYRWLGGVGVQEIECALADQAGLPLQPAGKVENLSAATQSTDDLYPAVATAPNGRIGIAWVREVEDSSWRINANVYFAILDAQGRRVYGPANLTGNTAYAGWNDYNVPRFYTPRIAASTDNHFVIAWQRAERKTAGWVHDVYYAVRDANGSPLKAVTPQTTDAGADWYGSPCLAGLSGGRALLAYCSALNNGASNTIKYAILDSMGTVVKPESNLFPPESVYQFEPDATQLSDGRTAIVWSSDRWGQSVIRYAVLDPAYTPLAGPTTLTNPAAAGIQDYPSVTADGAGHAIVTWTDLDYLQRYHVYYALVEGTGNLATPPMICHSSAAGSPYINISQGGQATAPFRLAASDGVDTGVRSAARLTVGDVATISVSVRYGNEGTDVAPNVTLTATLGAGVSYAGDSSGVTPAVNDNVVTWSLPDLAFLDGKQFDLALGLPTPPDPPGTRYSVTVAISSAALDAEPADNVALVEIAVPFSTFLPLALRS